MTYLLDTNTCIQYISNRNQRVINTLKTKRRSDIFVSDIVKLELYYGAYKSSRQESNLRLLAEFFGEFICLPFDSKSAIIAGQVRANLEKKGTPIGPYDLQIAAIAMANDLILVTHNVREFSRIEGLNFEDWETD